MLVKTVLGGFILLIMFQGNQVSTVGLPELLQNVSKDCLNNHFEISKEIKK